jgi:hypothetical protein
MSRTWKSIALLCALAVGCGGAKPHPFTDSARPLAQAMSGAVKAKNKATVDQIVAKADDYVSKSKITKGEAEVFRSVKDLCGQDKWDAAQALIDNSLAIKTQ